MKIENDILKIYQEINENKKNFLLELDLVSIGSTNYNNVKVDNDGTQNDTVNKDLLNDLQWAASKAGVVATITTASTGHSTKTTTGNESRHGEHTAVDIAILNGIGSDGATNETNGNAEFRNLGNKLKDALVSMGYKWNVESGNPKAVLWQTNTGGNHFNHLHVSNESTGSSTDSSSSTTTTGATTGYVDTTLNPVGKDPLIAKAASELASRIPGLRESAKENQKVFLTFCNVTNPKVRNKDIVSSGQVIASTDDDVKVFIYDEYSHKGYIEKNQYNLGKNVKYNMGMAIIPSSDNSKIRTPISGKVNNSINVPDCKNQITIESQEKTVSNKRPDSFKEKPTGDPLVHALLSAPINFFRDKEKDGKVVKNWGYPGEYVEPTIKNAIVAPFEKIGKILGTNKKLKEDIERIKKLL